MSERKKSVVIKIDVNVWGALKVYILKQKMIGNNITLADLSGQIIEEWLENNSID